MRHFAPAEEHRDLHLIASIEELRSLTPLGFKIMSVDLGANANFLEFDDSLMLAGLAFFSALFVTIFAVIHQSTDRRNCVRSHFDEIEPAVSGHLQRLHGWNNANLLAILVYQTNLTDPNPLVDPRLNRSCNCGAS